MQMSEQVDSHYDGGPNTNIVDYPYDDLVPNRPLPMPTAGMELDPDIMEIVRILRFNGVETFESCQGGKGHVSELPMVRFSGSQGEGYRAVAILLDWGYAVKNLQREWHIDGHELTGPTWKIILHRTQQK